MDLDKYRAAVIGLGFIGAGDPVRAGEIGQRVEDLRGSVHADVLAAHPRTTLVAGASRDAGRRERFLSRFPDAHAYADYREMLAAEQPRIVSVAANTPAHAEATVACAESGVRCVFCEKPIATRLTDADRMIAACQAGGTLLVMNHNRRWHPVYLAAREALRAGVVGEATCLMVRWPTGRLGNVGTHVFDALHLVMSERVVAVSGTLDRSGTPDCRGAEYRDPGGWGVVTFASGVHAHIEAAETLPPGVGVDIRVVGSRGELVLGDGGCCFAPWSGERQELAGPAPDVVTMGLAVDEIVACLETGAAPTSSGEDGRAALEVIVGFHASDRRQGQWVSLPLAGADRDLEVRIG
jgi:predicted dehydrogenase